MASVIAAHPSIRKTNHPFVYEPASEWRALLATFSAVFAVWATILLFALL